MSLEQLETAEVVHGEHDVLEIVPPDHGRQRVAAKSFGNAAR
jgi:hypothetical protein